MFVVFVANCCKGVLLCWWCGGMRVASLFVLWLLECLLCRFVVCVLRVMEFLVWFVCVELLECCVVVCWSSVVDCVKCHCLCVVAVMSSYVRFVRVIAVVNSYVPVGGHDAWSCLVVFVVFAVNC